MRKLIFMACAMIPCCIFAKATTKAVVHEEKVTMDSYLFGDPDPVVNINRIYPYFRFDAYSAKAVKKTWNMIVLENDFIKVYIAPEVGGKIWGAIEKSTGKEFLYFNHVAKFRDVAMRGAWSSGGLEYNFGDIGHLPTCSTPVDYALKNYPDGHVACVVGAIDLPSRTKWNVEIRLGPNDGFFETIATWANNSSLPCTYYHWMNAAAKASGNLEFIYPGACQIGHGGELGNWPHDEGHEIRFYDHNDFGFYKSYHVINSFSDFFGGYWHDDDFGYGHHCAYDDMPGKKLWIWGLSRQGMIWEDLLTDHDGQYIEYQAGKLFNQAAYSSTFTPFKHKEFLPGDTDVMKEIWFPLKGTKGMVDASRKGILNVVRKNGKVTIYVSALSPMEENLNIQSGKEKLGSKKITLPTLGLFTTTFDLADAKPLTVEVGKSGLTYTSDPNGILTDRPLKLSSRVNWNSAYGLYTRGLESEKQRIYDEAISFYQKSLKKDPGFLPAINRLAMALYRKMDYRGADRLVREALAIDTYDPEANYLFGLVSDILGNANDAMSGFSIAAASVAYRSAAYTRLAEIYLKEKRFGDAVQYAKRALSFNENSFTALEVAAIAYRKAGMRKKALGACKRISDIDRTNHIYRFERLFMGLDKNTDFTEVITNELPFETYLEIALEYYRYGCQSEALWVLSYAPEHPVVLLWKAFLNKKERQTLLDRALAIKVDGIFPHRQETADLLKKLLETNDNWKLHYYYALCLWCKGQNDLAAQQFQLCGDAPDSAAFYLGKAKLFSGDKSVVAKSLQRARKLAPADWRAAYATIQYDLANGLNQDAYKLSEEFSKKHPENSMLGMAYAQSLIRLGRYDACVSFLENYEVLPFEGATVGRDMYHEACIRRAYAALNEKNYKDALLFAQKAKLWPDNLGVGRPYEVDERLDDYLAAYALECSGKKDEAIALYRKIASYRHPERQNENTKLYLQFLAMEKCGEREKGLARIDSAIQAFPENEYLRWVKAEAHKDSSADQIRKEIISTPIIARPYDTRFIDVEFKLVTDFIVGIKESRE